MDQVSDNVVKIHLDMRLLDQYRVKYNKHASAEDLVKKLIGTIDKLLQFFLREERLTRTYYERLGRIKMQILMFDDRDSKRPNLRIHSKNEIRITILSLEANKILSLSDIRTKIFEDSLFGGATGEKENEIVIKNDHDISGNIDNVMRNKRSKLYKRNKNKKRKF